MNRSALNPWLVLGCSALTAASCWALLRPFTSRTNSSLQAVAALSDKTRVLCLGTSHVDCAVDPSLLGDDVMNLSGVALNYVCMEGVLAAHLKGLPSLETLVVEVDIFPFRYDTLHVIRKHYELLLDLDPAVAKMDLPLRQKLELGEWKFLRYSRWTAPFFSAYRFIPSEILVKNRRQPRLELNGDGDGGIHPGFRSFHQRISEKNDGRVKVGTHIRESSASMIPKNTDALIRIIRMGLGRNLRVILVRLPHHATYRSSRREVLDGEFEHAMTRVFASIEKGNLDYWDYDRVDALSDADYYDGDHLNGRGARIFTRILAKRL